MFAWNAAQYLKFADARTRPAAELLARVQTPEPTSVIDLGCGPGNSTELLAARWPGARIGGLDNDPDMIARARRDYPGLSFELSDIFSWANTGTGQHPVLYANAVFQWIADHEALFPALIRRLAPGGTLAVQMPRNFHAPSHTLMRKTAAEGPWAAKLTGIRELNDVPGPGYYYDLLTPLVASLDLWETEYTQVMPSVDGIIEWVKGSGLRPFLAALDPEEQQDFLARYRDNLRAAYPQQRDGRVLFYFKRIFIVARIG